MSLTDITKYFDRNSKKQDLSGNLNQEKGTKKLKEGSLNTSRVRDIPDKVFTESLTHFSPVLHFYTPWKHQKTKGFQMFSGGIEMWHWTKMG